MVPQELATAANLSQLIGGGGGGSAFGPRDAGGPMTALSASLNAAPIPMRPVANLLGSQAMHLAELTSQS